MKVKDETDGPPPEKKVKKEDAKEDKAQGEAYRKQMKKMFQYRDSLKSLKTTELTQILKYNKQDDAVGTERVSPPIKAVIFNQGWGIGREINFLLLR